jgi:hypothetical protein
MPAASTPMLSVQVLDFGDNGLLIQHERLLYGSCSSGQCFAMGFLPTVASRRRSCPSANPSPCRVDNRLSFTFTHDHCQAGAPCRAHQKKPRHRSVPGLERVARKLAQIGLVTRCNVEPVATANIHPAVAIGPDPRVVVHIDEAKPLVVLRLGIAGINPAVRKEQIIAEDAGP